MCAGTFLPSNLGHTSNVKARVMTALIGIPIVLAILFSPSPIPMRILCVLCCIQCTRELVLLLSPTLRSADALFFGILNATGTLALSFLLSPVVAIVIVCLPLLLLFGYAKKFHPMAKVPVVWLISPFLALIWLQSVKWNNHTYMPAVLLAIVPLWIGDSAAYFIGKAFGKHKLAPQLSPNKTVEGGVADLFGCVAASVGIGLWMGVPVLAAILCGIASGILGQVGDLHESSIKRTAGVKDSGTLLPGHGGLLDRLDSLLMSAPFVFGILALIPTGAVK